METYTTTSTTPETREERAVSLKDRFLKESVIFTKHNARVRRDSINPETDRFGLNQDANRDKKTSLTILDGILDSYIALELNSIPTLETEPVESLPPVETTNGGDWEQDPIDARGAE